LSGISLGISFMSHGWQQFWENENIFTETNWRRNLDIFIRGSSVLFEWNRNNQVLDIGCGPGHLEEYLGGKVKAITGLDTSEKFIRQCREKTKHLRNTTFHTLPEDYLDFSILEGHKFDIIICLSVVQYYRNTGEISRLIKEIKKYALPGARFLIADIVVNGTSVFYYFKLLWSAFKNRFLLEQIKFMLRARFSSYDKIRIQNGLLGFTVDELEAFAKSLNVKATILRTSLTLDPTRRHLLIQF